MLRVKIYSGLSLAKKDVHRVLPGAIHAGPIKRGDLIGDIKSGIQVLGIIDGEFFQSLAVSPSEILDAIRCGLTVFGSSSMGALRAAELDRLGMIGVGDVYNFIKSTDYFLDDHLGQVFFEGREEKSMTYIDFYFASLELVRNRRISKETQQQLCHQYSRMHFSDRSLAQLRHALLKAPKPDPTQIRALRLIENLKTTVKHQDGLKLLQAILTHFKLVKRAYDKLLKVRDFAQSKGI